MAVKRKPHHDLAAIQAKFADAESLEITTKAVFLYLKFAGETLIDVVLTSFKEA